MKSLVAALFASVSFAGLAQADDMFSTVRAVASDDGATTFEFARLDTSVMQMQPGETVTMNFGAGYEVELDRIQSQALGARSWVGRIEGQGLLNRVIITEMNGTVFGRISTPEGLWYVIPEGNGHRIMQMPAGLEQRYRVNDTIRITPEAIAAAMAESGEEPVVGEDVPVGSNGIVDVAVFYSQSFETQWGMTSGARVQHLVAVLDTALVDSDTGMRARLVYTGPVTLTEDDADQAQNLANLSGLTGDEAPTITQDLSALRAYRTSHGADLIGIIQLTQDGHGGCGIANILGAPASNGDINASWANQAYSVTGDWYGAGGGFCSDITYAHEVGHNLGMAHNVEDAGGVGTGVRTFAHGHRQDCDFITIMAYPTNGGACPGGAPRTIGNEMEATWFSNPSLTLCPNGQACGIAAPGEVSGVLTNDPADNARAAREESKDVVLFSAEAPRVVSSVLPITRSVQNGVTATAFATIINPASSGSTATGCGLRLGGATPAQFSYQTTNPATNAVTGTANTPVDLAAGGSQTFVFSVTSAATFDDNTGLTDPSANDERNLFIEAFCTNRRSAEFTLGLNTLTFTSSVAAPADVIALAATVGSSGTVVVPVTGNRTGVFSVAVTNVGASASITAMPDLGGRNILGVQALEICRTDPGTGACITPRAASQTLTLNTNDTATFGVFVRGLGEPIEFLPAFNRVFVRFNEGGASRGATSVAVRTP
ncbi:MULTISPECIES: reprolysin-like metallopeptidase [Hyphobacterium]|uniref:Reprolysin-like metallopeptidase n=1 Tax=Hyphobacterium vulgare TaxID=1736751 RepID=A0ABV6ZVF8_9PROT